jgi:hypothetical protein
MSPREFRLRGYFAPAVADSRAWSEAAGPDRSGSPYRGHPCEISGAPQAKGVPDHAVMGGDF